MIRGPRTQPHIGPMLVSEFSVRICYTAFYQCYDNGTKCSIEKRTKQWLGQWPNVYKYNVFNWEEDKSMIGAVTLMFHTVFHQLVQCVLSRRVFLSTGQWPSVICVHNETTLKGGNLPLLWYLGNWRNQVFCEIFRTQTLRLVSPWGCPSNPAYPIAQYIAQHTAYPSGDHHTA